jgi:hypothetical protein
MSDPSYPSLYQINTRVWLTELSRKLGRAATLDDVPDAGLDRLAGLGFGRPGRRRRRSRGRTPNGVASSRKRCRTSGTKTSPVPGSPSKITPYTAIWAAMRRSPVCDSGYKNADSS